MNAPLTYPTQQPPARAAGKPAAVAFTVLAAAQGVYYLATGIWPLVSRDTFLRVTGPKTDLWLVETVGMLVAAIGAALLVAGWRRRAAAEAVVLAVISAAGLTGIDVVYVGRGVIPPIYLGDAAAELLLLAGWAVAGVLTLRARPRPGEGP